MKKLTVKLMKDANLHNTLSLENAYDVCGSVQHMAETTEAYELDFETKWTDIEDFLEKMVEINITVVGLASAIGECMLYSQFEDLCRAYLAAIDESPVDDTPTRKRTRGTSTDD